MSYLQRKAGHTLLLLNFGLLSIFLLVMTYFLDGSVAPNILPHRMFVLTIVFFMLLSCVGYRNFWWQATSTVLGLGTFIWLLT